MKHINTSRKLNASATVRVASAILLQAAALGSSAVQAADPARGAQLYMRTDADGRSCVACHGPDPGLNHNNILRAADAPETLTKVLNTVSAMGFLRSQLSDSDRADITAFLGAVNRLNAADAGLRMWPVTADFGATLVGKKSEVQTVRLFNPSRTAGAAITSITGSNSQLELAHNCPSVLSPSASCDVQMRLNPASAGLVRAALEVNSPAFSSPVYAGLAGSGATGPLSLLEWQPAGAVLRFDGAATQPVLRRVIALANRGSMPAVLGLTSIVGPDASAFRIESGCTQGSVLLAGTQCDLTLLYTPNQLPVVQATLQLRSDQANPASVRLEGVAPPAAAPAPMEPLAAGGSGGGCSVGPPGQRLFDPVLALAALLAAWTLGRRRRTRAGK